MSRGKTLVIILTLILLGGGTAGGIILAKLTTPVVKFTTQMQEGQYEEAQAAYQDKIVVNETYSEEANEQVSAHLQEALTEYLNGNKSYESVLGQVEIVEEVMTALDMTATHERLTAIQVSKDGYEQAEKAYKKHKYAKAYDGYSQVMAEDCNYARATEQLEKLPKEFKKYVLVYSKKCMKKGNIIASYDCLYGAYHTDLLHQDKTIKKRLKKQKSSYTKKQMKRMAGLIRQKKYKKAWELGKELLGGKVKKTKKLKALKKKAKKLYKKQQKKKAKQKAKKEAQKKAKQKAKKKAQKKAKQKAKKKAQKKAKQKTNKKKK